MLIERTTLEAANWAPSPLVLSPMIAGVAPDSTERALDELRAAGVSVA